MDDTVDIILFGDQSHEVSKYFHEALEVSRRGSLVVSFLKKANAALSREFSNRSRRRGDDLPEFTSIEELGRRWTSDHSGSIVLGAVLLTAAQLIDYIGYRELQPATSERPKKTYVFGLCTGQLAASAISCAESLADLIPLAVETVCVAFRLGSLVQDVAATLHLGSEVRESWATTFKGISKEQAQPIIDDFHEKRKTHPLATTYISALTSQAITVSGPPRSLAALVESSESFKSAPHFSLPIYGPYHAYHLYEPDDLVDIINGIPPDESAKVALRPYIHPLISTKTGEFFEAANFSELLEKVVGDVLESPLDLDVTTKQLVSCVKEENLPCRLISIGPHNVGRFAANAIQQETGVALTSEDFSTRWTSEKITASASEQLDRPGIAIVGYSGRFPGANSAEELWDVLEQGLDLHKEIPNDRFNPETHVDPTGKKRNTSHTPYGCFIDNPGHFDPAAFNMSPREAKQTDPMQRLFLMTAYEALEMSGYVANRTPSTKAARIGTICGQTSDDYREVNSGHHVGTYFTTGTIRAFGPGRLNYFFKLDGPSYNVDTACSSSLAAIQLACSSIWRGEADTFIAGGVNIMTQPDQYAGLSRGQFLSKSGSCKTFDNDADGYCRGESVGTVILKRLDLAKADKDPIYGVIRSAGTNHSAQAVSITHPHAGTQETLYRNITREARLSPLDIDYIEMHGTGTQAGDFIEMSSVSSVFAPEVNPRKSHQPLYVGAVKANVGHGEAASGVTALIKTLLMFRQNEIPPHVGIKGDMNENFPDLNARNIKIAMKATPFRSQSGHERRAMVNNFSAAGGNTALILEEYLSESPAYEDPRDVHVVTVSARNPNLLRQTTERLVAYLEENPETSIPSLSYTTTARRTHGRLRCAVTGSTVNEITEKLLNYVPDDDMDFKPGETQEVPFAFTGQGALYTSFAKDFYDTLPSFRSDIQKFDSISQRFGFPSFIPLLDGSVSDVKELSAIETQVGQVCVQIALARLYKSWGVVPSLLIGHSLGEYPALHMAGILSISDTIYLTGARAKLLVDNCSPWTHKMLVVSASGAEMEDELALMESPCEIACRNGPKETVLSGPAEDIDSASAELSQQGFKCTPISVPYAFHSAQIDAILEKFEEYTAGVVYNKAVIPLISPSLETVIDIGETISGTYLCRHARDPVNFILGLENTQKQAKMNGEAVWLEIGPHPLCSGMIKATLGPDHYVLGSMRRDQKIWQTTATVLAELHSRSYPIIWSEYHHQFEDALEILELPRPSWELDDYWLPYMNDWTLTKGDPITEEEEGSTFTPTTTLHKIVEEYYTDDSAEVVFENDMHAPLLKAMVLGHLVNDTGLTPSSIYADMAMTAADYIHQRLYNDPAPAMDVADMKVSKPVIVSPADDVKGSYPLHVRANADINTNEVHFRFTTGHDKSQTLHATCCVQFGDAQRWESKLSRTSHLIANRIKELERGVNQGTSQKLRQRLVYKLFSALVNYSEPFRGMQSVVMGDEGYEGCSTVQFQSTEANGSFFCSPYWIDSVVHISGFVLNANDSTDSDKHVFISHGWESMRFLRPLQQGNTYKVYVSMVPEKNSTVMIGDVYAFEGQTLAAYCGGVTFQQIPRKQLNLLLPPGGGAAQGRMERSVSRTTSKATTPRRSPTSESPKTTPSSPKGAPSTGRSSAQLTEKKASSPSGDSENTHICQKALQVIAEEIGIEVKSLQNHKEFSQLGVDSLLSLTILGNLREDGIELPEAIFTDCPTVSSFKEYISETYGQQNESDSAEENLSSTVTRSITASSRTTTRGSSRTSSTAGGRTGQTSPTSTGSPERRGSREEKKAARSSTADILRPIISDEMGISEKELSEYSDLASLGMDSLMSLSVVGRLREETDLNPGDDLFTENRLLGEIETILDGGRRRPSSTHQKKSEKEPERPRRKSAATSQMRSPRSPPRAPMNDKPSAPVKPSAPPRPSITSARLRSYISVANRETSQSSRPTGTRETSKTPRSDQTRDMSRGSQGSNGNQKSRPSQAPTNREPSRTSRPPLTIETSRNRSNARLNPETPQSSASPVPRHATSILLQGIPSTASQTIFLLPDGSGSATSYNSLPHIDRSLAVYGLNCPFLRAAKEFNCGIEGVAKMYLDEVKRRKPKGPYILGGWSAGGIIAYEMTRQLMKAGEKVENLILIDTPCPLTIPPMPGSLIEFFNDIGLFSPDKSNSPPPPWLLEHFEASVRNMRQYKPKALDEEGRPQTAILWGRYGVCSDIDARPPDDDDCPSKEWILEDRKDFGDNGWSELVGTDQWEGFPVAGNHFTMMKDPNVEEVSTVLRKAILPAK